MAMIIKQREAAGKVGSADLVGDVKGAPNFEAIYLRN